MLFIRFDATSITVLHLLSELCSSAENACMVLLRCDSPTVFLFSVSLGSCRKYVHSAQQARYITCQQYFKLDKFTFQGPPRGPKVPFIGPRGPLTHQSCDKMCCNELPYHWNQSLYITCQQIFKVDKLTYQGPLRPFKGPVGPLTHQSYDKMCCNEFPYHWDQF